MNDDMVLSKAEETEEVNVVTIFSRHALSSGSSLYTAKDAASGTTQYRACEVEKSSRNRADWLDIRLADGSSFGLPYHLLTEISLSSAQNLSLIYASHVVTITGKHLDKVKSLMQRGKLLSLTCFDPKLHVKPADGEVVVTHIARQTIKEFIEG